MNLETNQEKIRHYLLGTMPEEETATLDERLVTDGDFYEELLIVEDELIDDYLSNELSVEARKSFETHFLLAPERRAQLRFANTFHGYLNTREALPELDTPAEEIVQRSTDVPKPPPKKKWYQSFLPVENPVLACAVIAAVVLIVAGISWFVMQNLRNPTTQEPGKVFIAALTPGGTRSLGATNKIIIPAGTGTIELRPQISGAEYVSYRAMLFADDGSEVWHADNLQSQRDSESQFLSVPVVARALPPGDYLLRLKGTGRDGKLEDLPAFSFRVVQ